MSGGDEEPGDGEGSWGGTGSTGVSAPAPLQPEGARALCSRRAHAASDAGIWKL